MPEPRRYLLSKTFLEIKAPFFMLGKLNIKYSWIFECRNVID